MQQQIANLTSTGRYIVQVHVLDIDCSRHIVLGTLPNISIMFVIVLGLFSGDVPGNGILIAGTRKSGDNKSIPSVQANSVLVNQPTAFHSILAVHPQIYKLVGNCNC